jgi:hypothetical protein
MSNDSKSNPAVIEHGLLFLDKPERWKESRYGRNLLVQPTASGDTFTVTLGDGTQVLRTGQCEAANQLQVFQMYGRSVTGSKSPLLPAAASSIFLGTEGKHVT